MPAAIDPAVRIERFSEVFDDALADTQTAPTLLSSVGRRKLIVTNVVKAIHRAGWVLADSPTSANE
ncbi:MAG: hypothetical protein WBA45_12700 [Microthrixaceae bacterium]